MAGRQGSLRYPLCASLAFHAVALALLGIRFHARPGIDVENLRVVDVVVATGGLQPEEVVREQPAFERQAPQKPQEAVLPKNLTSNKPVVKLPPVKSRLDEPQKQALVSDVRKTPLRAATLSDRRESAVRRSPGPPGDPGGPLNLGSTSTRGEDLGPTEGTTPLGWVPNPEGRGTGMGSGEGPGIGTPEPPKAADPGPGLRPNPAPEPRREAPPPRISEAQMEKPKAPEPTPVRHEPPKEKEPEPPKPQEPVLPDRAEPELIYRPNMSEYYPPSCREEGVEGDVVVVYTISEDGSVTDVQVVRKSGDSRLDRAAVRAAMAMKYKPAVQNGKPRAVKRIQKFEFRLE
jgi:protein TonB